MTEVLIAEGVWSPAFEGLSRRRSLTRVPAGEELQPRLLAECRALVVRNRTQVSSALLAAAPRLQIVARAGVGLDNLHLPAIDAAGVVAVAPLGVNAVSVAEHAVAMALAMAKGLVARDASTRAGGWDRRPSRELAGCVWGLLSAGATACATACLAQGLGMSVIAYDPYLDPADERLTAAGIRLAGLEEVLRTADVISMHLPATPQTNRLIDATALTIMKPDAYLINVGRGEAIDEDALVDALRSGRLAGVALDVRTDEPPAPGRLEGAPRTLLSPHVAGITTGAQDRIGEVLAQQIDRVLDGDAATAAVGSLDRPFSQPSTPGPSTGSSAARGRS